MLNQLLPYSGLFAAVLPVEMIGPGHAKQPVRAAASGAFDRLIHLVADHIFEAELLLSAISPFQIGAEVLGDNDNRPAQFLILRDSGPHLGVVDEIAEREFPALDGESPVRRHVPLSHLGDKLVLVPLSLE